MMVAVDCIYIFVDMLLQCQYQMDNQHWIAINSYHFMTVSLRLVLVLCMTNLLVSAQQDCNSTHLEYFSEYYLGRQDELNKTFIKIQQRIQSLNNVSFRANDSATYVIGGIHPKFQYLDSKQRADIVGRDTVIVEGGRVEVTFDFQWGRQGTGIGGTGSAYGLSDVLAFSFLLDVKDGFLVEVLQDYDRVKFDQNLLKITRISPADISAEDLKIVGNLLNNIINVTTVRLELEDEVDKIYHYLLSQSLYDDRRIIDEHYEYEWVGSKGKLLIPYEIRATAVDIEPTGITLTYIARIKDYSGWKCQNHAPVLPLNPRVYGGIQEFITFDVYRNSLRYAIDNGHLDVELDRRSWESRFFQFYAGDLYEVIPKVARNFLASEPVTGSCRTGSRNLNMIKGGYDYFNVSMNYNCEIGVNRDKVAEFQLNLTMAVEGRPNETNIEFRVINQTHNVTLIPYMDYQIQNPTLALHMISHSLNRLHDHRVFGSGWKLYPRDYPHFIVEDNYTIVYDSTHVDPHDLELLQ